MGDVIPILDLATWRSATPAQRSGIVEAIDGSLRRTGTFLLSGHSVPAALSGRMRRLAQRFFSLPPNRKARYAVEGPYGNGWRGPGLVQSSAYRDGPSGPPDLHEAFHVGPVHRTGDPAVDDVYYPPNRWPEEVPDLRQAVTEYTGHMVRLAHEVLTLLAAVLGIAEDTFTSRARRATWTQNLNWYPSLATSGLPAPGQLYVGPHSDFGTITLLDREAPGRLEGWDQERGWFPISYVPGTLAVMAGDPLRHWTDDRWTALRHRVLAPDPDAPHDDLVSLVFFFEADPETVVVPLPAPAGGGLGLEPVVAGETILEKVGVINAPRLT